MGELLLVLVSVRRGCKNPLSDADTSSLAELAGLVVPMPTCATNEKVKIKPVDRERIILFITIPTI